jgi:hypothetical protein
LYKKLIKNYKEGMEDMDVRAPGYTTKEAVYKLSIVEENGHRIPFNPR